MFLGDPNIEVSNRGQHLKIKSARLGDQARYQCSATNAAGKQSKDFNLSIFGNFTHNFLDFKYGFHFKRIEKILNTEFPAFSVCPSILPTQCHPALREETHLLKWQFCWVMWWLWNVRYGVCHSLPLHGTRTERSFCPADWPSMWTEGSSLRSQELKCQMLDSTPVKSPVWPALLRKFMDWMSMVRAC